MPTILLIEDNESNRDMLSRRLVRRGFHVLHAENGEQGLRLARGNSPDLILTDMSLPEIDGWELARRLKNDAVTAQIPIIALTAHAMAGDREAAVQAGCDDYDTKPIDLTRLLAKMEALLGAASCASRFREDPTARVANPLPVQRTASGQEES